MVYKLNRFVNIRFFWAFETKRSFFGKLQQYDGNGIIFVSSYVEQMKKTVLAVLLLAFGLSLHAQDIYVMGYRSATIDVVDKGFFSQYQLPGQEPVCGRYDKLSATFYTCDFKTYRGVDDDMIVSANQSCCDQLNFDPALYYGTLTMYGTIESVEWDSLRFTFKTDKARMLIHTNEKEIDALYNAFYKENHFGKINVLLQLKTYDTPKEDQLSYNKNSLPVIKPKRTETKILRW
jgi:hypothetical protein